MGRHTNKVAIATLLLCAAVGGFVAVSSAVTLQKVADGAIFFGDERILTWQIAYGATVSTGMVLAVILALLGKPQYGWKLAVLPVLLTVAMFMLGGGMLEVVIIGLGTFGAVRLRHVALAESMMAAMSDDGP